VGLTSQIHDFNPGIHPFPDGLFWTLAISSEHVSADVEEGTASYSLSNVKLRDFTSLPNSLGGGNSVPARASFKVRWTGITGSFATEGPDFSFQGHTTNAHIDWSASEAGFSFKSDPTGQAYDFPPILGHERNGRFRSEDD
jgi:hypothetical protein